MAIFHWSMKIVRRSMGKSAVAAAAYRSGTKLVNEWDGVTHDYAQYRKACRLVHECCNYDQGNCLLLDRGDGCICVQRISYSLLCRWFQTAVLPLDHELYAVLLCKPGTKRCCLCGRLFVPRSNRAKYCPSCASRMKQHMARERKRKQRRKCHALGPEKVL